MRNVAGISQTESQKSSDMLMKCMYLDEVTGGHGIVFATGTPISNSMTEMYVMMRYLQRGLLEKEGLLNFDSWASTFGESITAIELNPTGTGYRTKTRFARFYNLPELMSLLRCLRTFRPPICCICRCRNWWAASPPMWCYSQVKSEKNGQRLGRPRRKGPKRKSAAHGR